MSGTTKKAVAFMIIVLVVLVVIIVILASRDKVIKTPEELGETVLTEKATEIPTEAVAAAPEQAAEQAAEPAMVDVPNEKEMRLYVDGGGYMQLISEYRSAWTPEADIAIFEAFNSAEPAIYYDSYYTVHEDVWNAVATDTAYKIGYEISFTVNGEEKVYTILGPQDISGNPELYMGDYPLDEYENLITDGITGYLGVWVYNDIGQTGVYVHLTQEDMTEGTLLTSIKLRPTPQTSEISNLKLKVFSYSSQDEFNSAGRYIGTHGYEIPVINEG